MKRIFLEDRYIIIDDDPGIIYNYSARNCYYEGRDPNNTKIVHPLTNGSWNILTASVGTWYDEAGTTAYTYATLIAFLKLNTQIV